MNPPASLTAEDLIMGSAKDVAMVSGSEELSGSVATTHFDFA